MERGAKINKRDGMKDKIITILKKNAIRTQVLGDNRLHSLISDDEFETVAKDLIMILIEEELDKL